MRILKVSTLFILIHFLVRGEADNMRLDAIKAKEDEDKAKYNAEVQERKRIESNTIRKK